MDRPGPDASADEWSVYGDHLQTIGDPRGPVIALASNPRAQAVYVRQHAVEVLGEAAAKTIDLVELAWRGDAVIGVEVRVTEAGARAGSALRALFRDHPIARVKIVAVTRAGRVIDVRSAVRALADAPASLASVELADTSTAGERDSRIRFDSLDEVWRIPNLESATIAFADGQALGFGTIETPQLRRLAIRTIRRGDRYTEIAIANACAAARWPSLESFELRLTEAGEPAIDWTGMRAMFDGLVRAPLRRLAIHEAVDGASLLEVLADVTLPATLAELDLSDCTFTAEEAERAGALARSLTRG